MNPRERASNFAITAAWIIVAAYALLAALMQRPAAFLPLAGVWVLVTVVFNAAVRQWLLWAADELGMPWQRALDRYELRERQLPASMARMILVLYVLILAFFPVILLTIVPLVVAETLVAPGATVPLAWAAGLMLLVPVARAALRSRVCTTAATLIADLDPWKARRRDDRLAKEP